MRLGVRPERFPCSPAGSWRNRHHCFVDLDPARAVPQQSSGGDPVARAMVAIVGFAVILGALVTWRWGLHPFTLAIIALVTVGWLPALESLRRQVRGPTPDPR